VKPAARATRNHSPETKEKVRAWAPVIGLRAAARKFQVNEDTACWWAHREKWVLPAVFAQIRIRNATKQAQSIIHAAQDEVLREQSEQTMLYMSAASLKASYEAAQMKESNYLSGIKRKLSNATTVTPIAHTVGAQPGSNHRFRSQYKSTCLRLRNKLNARLITNVWINSQHFYSRRFEISFSSSKTICKLQATRYPGSVLVRLSALSAHSKRNVKVTIASVACSREAGRKLSLERAYRSPRVQIRVTRLSQDFQARSALRIALDCELIAG